MINRKMTAEEFDEYFDNGGDISELIIEDSITHPNREDDPRRINLNMPGWMIDALDDEARHLAIPRQSVIIMWLAERIKAEKLAS